jgi:hypothetical protein
MYRVKRNLGIIPFLIAGILITSLIFGGIWLSSPPLPSGAGLAPGDTVSRFSPTEIAVLSVTGIIWLVLVAALLISLFMRHSHKKQFSELVSNSMPAQQLRLTQQPIALSQQAQPVQQQMPSSQQSASNMYNQLNQSNFRRSNV